MNRYQVAPADPNTLRAKAGLVLQSYDAILKRIAGQPIPRSVAQPAEFMKVCAENFEHLLQQDPANIDGAVDQAANIAMSGGNIASAFLNSPTFNGQITAEIGDLMVVKEDLEQYCAAHAMQSGSSIAGKSPPPGPRSTFGFTQEQLLKAIGEAQANIESSQQEARRVEARLKGLDDTAGNLGKRIESIAITLGDEARAGLEQQLKELNVVVDSALASISQRQKALDEYERKADTLLSQLSIKTLAGGYADGMSKEASAANWFRGGAIAMMILAAGLIGETLVRYSFFGQSWDQTWPALIIRAVFSLAVAVPTAYLAREGAKHRAQAIDLRRTSLDFAALDGYLKELDPEVRNKLRADLALRVFFTGVQADAASSYSLDPQQLMMKAMDIAADLAKQKR